MADQTETPQTPNLLDEAINGQQGLRSSSHSLSVTALSIQFQNGSAIEAGREEWKCTAKLRL